jgi:hypothetical protein
MARLLLRKMTFYLQQINFTSSLKIGNSSMDAHFIPTVLPTAKMICQLLQAKEERQRVENIEEPSKKIERYKIRLNEQIEYLEKELKKRGDFS